MPQKIVQASVYLILLSFYWLFSLGAPVLWGYEGKLCWIFISAKVNECF